MSLNKKILAAAIVSGLFSTSALAQVVISNATPIPVRYAEEIVATSTAPVTLAAITENKIESALLYNFSVGEVRYARVECSPHIRFATNSTVTISNIGGQLGSINGLGTNVITFSITADTAPLVSADTITIDGDRSITNAAAGTCSFSLYDQPSQALAGGTTGRIVTTGDKPYLAVGKSFRLVISSPRTSVADVEANPSFGNFVADAPTTASTAALATLLYDVPASADQTRLPNGALIASSTQLASILGANTAIRVNATNDGFSAVANADGTYTGAALNRVYISSSAANCTLGTAANSITATQASFTVGPNVTIGPFLLCLERRAGNLIPVSDFTTGLNAVAASAAYAPTSIAAVASGNIVRNGTQLQAPLAQVPTGWLSRMVLTNTGGLARPYTISVQGETGNTISTNNLTGTIPANGTTVVDLNTVLTGFTGAPRATLNVTVAGPNSQIQGLYQIVNPDKGSISNHVMVRPGTN